MNPKYIDIHSHLNLKQFDSDREEVIQKLKDELGEDYLIKEKNRQKDKPKEIIIAGDPKSADTIKMVQEVHRRFIPNKILMVIDEGKNRESLTHFLPFLEGIRRIKGKSTAYVCINYACELPTNDLQILQKILDENR